MGKKGGNIWLLNALAVAGLLVGTADASQFRKFGRDAQVQTSDLIVIGRVVSVSSDWDAQHSAIHTDAEIALDEVWKGNPASDRIVTRTLGGTVGDVALEVDGAAKFTAGERVLVFLRTGSDGAYVPWGMRFGKYEVIEEGGSAFAVGTMPPTVAGAQHYPQISLPLDDLRSEVMSLAAGEAK